MNKVVFLAVMLSISIADIPQKISYQGVLTDVNNTLVLNNTYSITFFLYDESSAEIWSEEQPVAVINGLFNVILGSINPLDLPFDEQYTLGISVNNSGVMDPVIPFTSSAYSLNARQVKGSNLFPADGDAVVSGNISVSGNVSANSITGDGSGITDIVANNISSGVLNNNRFNALSDLGGGSGTEFLRKDGAWAAPDENTDTQDLSISDHTISLTNGGSVTVPDNYAANTDNQSLSYANSTDVISISNGNSIDISEVNTDTQDLSISGHTISLTNGNSVTVPDNYAANTDTQLSDENVEDYVGGMVTSNTETYITVTYQDNDGTLDFTLDSDLNDLADGTLSDSKLESTIDRTGFTASGNITVGGDLFVNDFARIDALRVGTSNTDPGDKNLYVEGDITVKGDLDLGSNSFIRSDNTFGMVSNGNYNMQNGETNPYNTLRIFGTHAYTANALDELDDFIAMGLDKVLIIGGPNENKLYFYWLWGGQKYHLSIEGNPVSVLSDIPVDDRAE